MTELSTACICAGRCFNGPLKHFPSWLACSACVSAPCDVCCGFLLLCYLSFSITVRRVYPIQCEPRSGCRSRLFSARNINVVDKTVPASFASQGTTWTHASSISRPISLRASICSRVCTRTFQEPCAATRRAQNDPGSARAAAGKSSRLTSSPPRLLLVRPSPRRAARVHPACDWPAQAACRILGNVRRYEFLNRKYRSKRRA